MDRTEAWQEVIRLEREVALMEDQIKQRRARIAELMAIVGQPPELVIAAELNSDPWF